MSDADVKEYRREVEESTDDARRAREVACTTTDCPGDGRYAAPGRGHAEGCTYPRPTAPDEGGEGL